MPIYNPSHPGEILRDCIYYDKNDSISKAAKSMGISRITLSRLCNCKIRVTKNLAERIGKYYNTSWEMWYNLQKQYDGVD